MNGKTVLPMPAGLERIAEVERSISEKGPGSVDLYLKSAIEGVVIKWAYLVNEVVAQESGSAFDNGQNPTPDVELDYWSARQGNLRYAVPKMTQLDLTIGYVFSYIFDQLREDRVKKMAIMLEKTDSAYYPCFRTLFGNTVSALAEAKEISLHLSPLTRFFKAFEESDFSEAKPLMAVLVHAVGLAWSASKYYQSSSKVIVMLRQIGNLIIRDACKFLDPSLIFQSDADEALQRVRACRGEGGEVPKCSEVYGGFVWK